MTADDIVAVRDLVRHYRDLALGVADASILVLCDRHDTGNVLTLDRRHFLAASPHSGRALTLAPG